jgi:hypothetical protein
MQCSQHKHPEGNRALNWNALTARQAKYLGSEKQSMRLGTFLSDREPLMCWNPDYLSPECHRVNRLSEDRHRHAVIKQRRGATMWAGLSAYFENWQATHRHRQPGFDATEDTTLSWERPAHLHCNLPVLWSSGGSRQAAAALDAASMNAYVVSKERLWAWTMQTLTKIASGSPSP